MSIGNMRSFVTFQTRTETRTNAAAVEYTFSDISGLERTPCHYRPDRGFERVNEGRIEAAEQGRIKVRSCDATRGLRESDVGILHERAGDRQFKILAIDNRDNRDRFLYITVEFGTVTN